jgi:hypothetical protein
MKCQKAMWYGWGGPAGVCGEQAYGPASKDSEYPWLMQACPAHGGPRPKDVAHEGDPCVHCGTGHDDVEPGPCPGRSP